MALQTVTVYQKDQLPKLEVRLYDQKGIVLDPGLLSSVRLYLAPFDGGANIINGAALTLIDKANCLWAYTWTVEDTSTPGEYRGEVVVTYATTQVETAGQFKLVVLPSLHG